MIASPAISFRLPARIKKKKGVVIASCPSLDVVTQGDSLAQAKKNLSDATGSFLESCWRRGTLDEVLRACGLGPARRPRRVRADYFFEVSILAAAKAA